MTHRRIWLDAALASAEFVESVQPFDPLSFNFFEAPIFILAKPALSHGQATLFLVHLNEEPHIPSHNR
jgi:hypothetical protein